MCAARMLCTLACLLALSVGVWACNEAVCASLVSKCMLLQSCECNLMDTQNCTCCKACHLCLARLYTECCSCVGMCPGQPDQNDDVYRSSTVEELSEPIPELFNVLTEEPDPYLRWTAHTYPAHLDLLYFKPRGVPLHPGVGADQGVGESSASMNCTVAYMSECVPLRRCRLSCQSMGARRYRWFHAHGCCECIGSSCLDYGKGEPLCLHCSESVQRHYAAATVGDDGGGHGRWHGDADTLDDVL